MSLDLVVLTRDSATSRDQAMRVYREEDDGSSDERRISAFARELDQTYGDDDWPFVNDPIVFPSHVLLTIDPERWFEVVPEITARAQRHDLAVLDPQVETLFPHGTPYDPEADDAQDDGDYPRRGVEITVHHGDGSIEELGGFSDSWWQRWRPDQLRKRRRLRNITGGSKE